MNGAGSAGLHRVYWDLRDTPSRGVTFRTSPLYAPEITGRSRTVFARATAGSGSAAGGLSVLQAPGPTQ